MPKRLKKKVVLFKKGSESDLEWNKGENNNDPVLDMIDNSFVEGVYKCKKMTNL